MDLSLNGNTFCSECERHQKIIVSKEKRSKHIADNPEGDEVSHYKVDGNIITGNTAKCDFLLMDHTKHSAYLIELKGSDLLHAMEQLDQTDLALQFILQGYTKNFRVVLTRTNTHAITPQKARKLEKELSKRGSFHRESQQMRETI